MHTELKAQDAAEGLRGRELCPRAYPPMCQALGLGGRHAGAAQRLRLAVSC